MPAKRVEDAVDEFLTRRRQAALCITDEPLIASGYRVSPDPLNITFGSRGEPVQLRSESRFPSVMLAFRHVCQIVEADHGRWSVETTAYWYHLLDREGRELLAYHWHPRTVGPIFPHLHISSRIGTLPVARNVPPVALGEMHLPTSHVPFAAVVRLLIGEFQIAPKRGDWEAALAAGEAAFAIAPARPD